MVLNSTFLWCHSGLFSMKGTPLPFILDLILIKAYGISYILIVPLIIGLICLIHCILIRKANLSIPLWDRITKKNQQTIQLIKGKFNIGIKEIITIRSLPLMPFILGNLIIAKSNFNLKEILIFTSIGSYIYYFILYILTNF